MSVREELALIGIVSEHSPNLIESGQPLPSTAVRRYAKWSQVRIRNWLAALDELPQEIMALPDGLRPLAWQRAEILLADVLIGGLVARVWGAVLTACDCSRRSTGAAPTARAALVGQMQAQNAVLRMLVDGPHLALERLRELDQLRRKTERWTDLLLGHIVRRYALEDFACDLERALDFGDEQLREGWGPRRSRIWDFYQICLQSAFPGVKLPGGIQAEWRQELLLSILGCFPADVFLDEGPIKSVRLQRLLNGGNWPDGPPAAERTAAVGQARWQNRNALPDRFGEDGPKPGGVDDRGSDRADE